MAGFSAGEKASRQRTQRLGALNGALIGAALALGAWGPAISTLAGRPVREAWASYVVGTAVLVLAGATAGWLSARSERALVRVALWLAAALIMVWTIGHRPYDGQALVIGGLDSRFRGLDMFPFDDIAAARMVTAGFFIVLVIVVLAIVQELRLESIEGEMDGRGRLGGRGWVLLLAPMLVVFATGLVADALLQRPQRLALVMVDEVISVGRAYEGDLFALSRETGVNYNAVKGLQNLMTGPYTLQVANADLGFNQAVVVTAAFGDDVFINCRAIVDPESNQVSHCQSANLPYTAGFAALVTGELLDCKPCRVVASTDLQARLHDWGRGLDGPLAIRRLGQWGSHVLMRASSQNGDRHLECLFRGASPVTLVRCREALP